MKVTGSMKRDLKRANAAQPDELRAVSPAELPDRLPFGLQSVWRSKSFLVQAHLPPVGSRALLRLSVCRTSVSGDRWKDGITWDELQEIKRQCGYGDLYAVEIYPADEDLVDVAAMRHLFILAEPPPFAWRKAR